MEADAFTIRYRLLPLLQKRVEILQLQLDRPVIHLVRDAAGTWNYEKIAVDTGATDDQTAAATADTGQPGGLDVSLRQIAMTDGRVEMRDADGDLLLSLADVGMTTAVDLVDNRLTGRGQAGIGELNVANSLRVGQLTAPLNITTSSLQLDPLRGTCAGGRLSGTIAYRLRGGAQYEVNLQLADAEVPVLLREAGAPDVLSGKLQATTILRGTAGVATITGQGRAEVTDGTLSGVPFLDLAAALLQIPDLQQVRFSECRLEFTIANNEIHTPMIRVVAPRLELTGRGRLSLDEMVLDHDFNLAVDRTLLARLPQEVRAVFTEREDGYLTIAFKVTGPYDKPKTDLAGRIVRGTTDQLIQKGLRKLFE